MIVKLLSINDIWSYEGNPRVNDQAVDAVAASLREFGFRQPIVVDPGGVIIVGHTRWKAAKKLGLVNVPVHVARDLTPEQIKAYRIADNQTATLARRAGTVARGSPGGDGHDAGDGEHRAEESKTWSWSTILST